MVEIEGLRYSHSQAQRPGGCVQVGRWGWERMRNVTGHQREWSVVLIPGRLLAWQAK